MLRYELETRGDMDGTDDSSNYHYSKLIILFFNILYFLFIKILCFHKTI